MDNDASGGSTGAVYDYGFRIYDTRIAKFLSVDPLTKDYPELTPYQYASNRPIDGIDLDGLEWLHFSDGMGAESDVIINVSGMNKDEIKKILKQNYSMHQGNLSVKMVESMNEGTYWRITDITNLYMRSLGTRIEGFSSKDNFDNNYHSYKEIHRDLSQSLHSRDKWLEEHPPVSSVESGIQGEAGAAGHYSKGKVYIKAATENEMDPNSSVEYGKKGKTSTSLVSLSAKVYLQFNHHVSNGDTKVKFTIPLGIGGITIMTDKEGWQATQFYVGTKDKGKMPEVQVEKKEKKKTTE